MADYDIIIIGGGPGGYTAAIRAAQLGLKTAVVEREHLGGICSNWGCIPTKALLRSAEMMTHAAHFEDFGITLTGKVKPDIARVVARSRGVAERMAGGVAMLLRKNKVDVIWGEARLAGGGIVEVAEPARPAQEPQAPRPKGIKPAGRYSADHIVLATGARPRVLPGIEPDGDRIWTYFEALKPAHLPKSLIVVGSGAIGVEFASFYAAMGTEVTVVEVLDRILPAEDAEISAFMEKALGKRGIAFRTGARVEAVKAGKSAVSVTLTGGETLKAERLISAAGIVANTEGLGLEEAGVALDGGIVRVDAAGRTSAAGIWAIGDITGAPMLAHKAEHEAMICVETIAGGAPHALDRSRIPGCTYCDPQVASIGLTEAAAREGGHAVRVGTFPFLGNGKAIAMGEDQGMAKVIFDADTGELLGAHLAGAEVTELIQGFATAMALETTEAELFDVVFPHPTISEVMKEAALAAFGRAINI
ncbi:dihydrolipoyl dehydrogenase [Sinisalibacter aestuarii]|uniref:Dihydrolipoyl dehydrogenase n=1 Tax=Sinisalibacter aestuarii TaxID=2949426 RepID=A0ABQ5LX85_9RHOB|nr:dihydrolipoyl dehydrogenase [Sinisalibacter aestuarii]GKY89600.1 dihydrolipoyl dehydrogenase [Sinisalibacter aestuarii]